MQVLILLKLLLGDKNTSALFHLKVWLWDAMFPSSFLIKKRRGGRKEMELVNHFEHKDLER
jgi:hypothetical protein